MVDSTTKIRVQFHMPVLWHYTVCTRFLFMNSKCMIIHDKVLSSTSLHWYLLLQRTTPFMSCKHCWIAWTVSVFSPFDMVVIRVDLNWWHGWIFIGIVIFPDGSGNSDVVIHTISSGVAMILFRHIEKKLRISKSGST